MKIITVLILVLLLLFFTNCDFLVYYTFLSSESPAIAYTTHYPDQTDMFQESKEEWYLYADERFNKEQNYTDSPEWYEKDMPYPEKEDTSSPISLAEKFTLIVLPDTQYYTAYYPHIFDIQLEISCHY